MQPSSPQTFRAAVNNNNWNWGFEEFARRCKLDPASMHAQAQWELFQQLHRTLCALDCDILAVIGTLNHSSEGVTHASI